MIKHLNIRVSGKVQGVYYRANTQAEALKLGLKGFVQNESNGDVYIEAEGTEEQLSQFVEWCKKGPTRAIVKNILLEETPLKNYADFSIKR